MTASAIERVRDDRLAARRERDVVRTIALGTLLNALEEAAKATPARVLDEAGEIAVLRRERKRRTEAAESFREGGREDDALREELEGRIIDGYLPAEIDADTLAAIVDAAVGETGATSLRDLGAVMKVVLARTGGRADGKVVAGLVRSRLGA